MEWEVIIAQLNQLNLIKATVTALLVGFGTTVTALLVGFGTVLGSSLAKLLIDGIKLLPGIIKNLKLRLKKWLLRQIKYYRRICKIKYRNRQLQKA